MRWILNYKVKAKLDKVLNGKKVLAGFSSQLIGRIRGSNRSRKKVIF
jgi:hypothetical protein